MTSPFHRLPLPELPFAVDDYAEAAAAFVRWREAGDEQARETAVLWSYCYALSYLSLRFASERASSPSDLDAAIASAVQRITGSLDRVEDPAKFPHYVMRLCYRVLLTHRKRRQCHVEVQEHDLRTPEPDLLALDGDLVWRAVEEAIRRLPPAIGEVARMRLIERRSYQDIAESLCRPIDSVRTYYSKSIRRLRNEPRLRSIWLEEPRPASFPAACE